ncbi:MAG: protein-disulfide isomerase [Sphingomonadales bacterium 63-6]|nr:MAG: protein-disulfide isomerase [Sphingomonadales bacterium 63-6]
MDAMKTLRQFATLSLAIPLTLALAACGSKDEKEGELPVSEPIAHIAPPAGQQWADVSAETPEGGFRLGNPDAPLKLVEYASHTCSHCADFSVEGAEKLRDKYVASGVLSYEIRNLIREPLDLTIATLARCSGPQAFHPLAEQAWANLGPIFDTANKNKEVYAAAMEKTGGARFQGIAEAAGLYDFFAQRGISRDQAMQCLSDVNKITEIVNRSDKDSKDLEITGTPTFFLNGKRIEFTTWDAVEPVLQNAGAR